MEREIFGKGAHQLVAQACLKGPHVWTNNEALRLKILTIVGIHARSICTTLRGMGQSSQIKSIIKMPYWIRHLVLNTQHQMSPTCLSDASVRLTLLTCDEWHDIIPIPSSIDTISLRTSMQGVILLPALLAGSLLAGCWRGLCTRSHATPIHTRAGWEMHENIFMWKHKNTSMKQYMPIANVWPGANNI